MENTSKFTKFTPEELQTGNTLLKWNPALSLFLYGDGSNTLNLGLLTQSKIQTELLRQYEGLPGDSLVFPEGQEGLKDPFVHRSVYLKDENGRILMYAESLWNKDAYERVMKNKSIAIGTNISKQKMSYFRDIHYVGVLTGDEVMNKKLNNSADDVVLVRHYSMYHDEEKLCVIQEYFSNEINKILSVSLA